MDIIHYVILIVGGLFGGFINVLIGGGGLIILPVYMGVGLPASIANGTNRVNLLIQNCIALYKFSKKGKMNWRMGVIIGIPTAIGTIIGALLATNINDELLHILLLVIIIFSFFYILFNMDIKKKCQVATETVPPRKINWLTLLLFLAAGFYAGFISVGVGMLWYALFNWRVKIGFVKILAIKVLLAMIVAIIALTIFTIAGKVNFVDGLVLGIGSGTGAWISSMLSMKLSKRFIRNLMLVILTIAGLYMLLFKILNLF